MDKWVTSMIRSSQAEWALMDIKREATLRCAWDISRSGGLPLVDYGVPGGTIVNVMGALRTSSTTAPTRTHES